MGTCAHCPARAVETIAGIPTYVEESGSGPALLYLHGATEWVGYSAELTALLAGRFRVIQPERRGHGRTPDVPGLLTFAAMTSDTAALIEHYGVGPVNVVGFSDGAIIGLLLAIERPELVARLVAIGPNARVDGLTDEALGWLEQVTPETWPRECYDAYARLSPDGPGHWPVFLDKVVEMLLREPDISAGDLARITAPTLLIGGERDMVRQNHFLELHEAIPGSELCILPGVSHEVTTGEPLRAFELTSRFLAGEPTGAR